MMANEIGAKREPFIRQSHQQRHNAFRVSQKREERHLRRPRGCIIALWSRWKERAHKLEVADKHRLGSRPSVLCKLCVRSCETQKARPNLSFTVESDLARYQVEINAAAACRFTHVDGLLYRETDTRRVRNRAPVRRTLNASIHPSLAFEIDVRNLGLAG